MRRLGLLLSKELLGQHRSFRLWIALGAYLMVGLVSPLLAAMIPELLSKIPADQLRGVEILLTKTPDLLDALGQYHKNMTTMPLLLVLLGMGAVSSELPGTASLVLGAGAGRARFLAAKLLSQLLVATVGTALAAGAFALYAAILFSAPDPAGFIALNLIYLLVYALVLALTLLGGALGRGQALAAAFGLGGFFLISALGAFPSLAAVTPGGLLGLAGALMQGALVDGEAPDPLGPVLSGLASAGLLVWLAIRRFARLEI